MLRATQARSPRSIARMTLALPMLAGLLASTAALFGSILILSMRDRAERLAQWLVSFAIGTLLGAAILSLLPEALAHAAPEHVAWLFLAGIVAFIAFERVLRWRHPHHHDPGETHRPRLERETGAMILWGDAIHNFTDGLVLGVSFQVGWEAGLAAAIAIFAHEVPQEIGDFAILLDTGMPRVRALLLNYLSALTVIPGAGIAFVWSGVSVEAMGWLLPLAAGGFVYIALADLIPALQHHRGITSAAIQLGLIMVGIAVIAALGAMAHG
jgi:zinc and cadmium transporter